MYWVKFRWIKWHSELQMGFLYEVAWSHVRQTRSLVLLTTVRNRRAWELLSNDEEKRGPRLRPTNTQGYAGAGYTAIMAGVYILATSG